MTPIRLMWFLLATSWVLTEIVLARRSKSRADCAQESRHDRGSLRLLWRVALAGLLAALVLKELRWLPMGWEGWSRQFAAVMLFGAGIVLRLWAIVSLGRFFDTRVTLHDQHRLIRTGPYRHLRHPSYTGLLLAFAGAGVAMGDWLAVAALTLPATTALGIRIRVEEAALAAHFPLEYPEYCRRTWKLIPGLF